jgi:ribonuclease HIII
MATIEDYVSKIEETCGEERHFIAFLKYERKSEAIKKILEKAKIEKSISSIIFELTFKGISMRVYTSGKVLFKNLKDKNTLLKILSELLL